MFFAAYADELDLPDEEWRRLARGGDFVVFGLFDGERLVGITGAFTHRDDPTGRTAVLGMTYLEPDYRGRRVSALMYGARLAWARAQRRFERVVVSHRRANVASGRAIARHGFTPTGVARRRWHDGTEDDELLFELRLSTEPAATD